MRLGRRREDGVSLVLVLVTLVVFGLLVPVLGQFGSVNGISGYVVKGQRYDRYAADSGMQAAIAWAQSRRSVGREYGPCADVTTHLDGTTASTTRDVTVSCVGYAGSGQPLGDGDTPAYAVLALGDGGSGDHAVDIDTNGKMTTSGAWWANGDPGQTSADIHRVQIDASADLFGATGGCRPAQGAVLDAAPERCDAGLPPKPDPNYDASIDSNLTGMSADPVYPSDDCSAVDGNGVVALAPGIHWDAAWLSHLTSGACGRVVVWLQPGKHYFDFDFYDPGNDRAGDNVWTIGGSGSNSVTVVGGTPQGWNPGAGGAVTTTDNAATDAGACATGAQGVELTLGSQSQIEIERSAHVELCPLRPLTDTGGQHLAVSGPRRAMSAARRTFRRRARGTSSRRTTSTAGHRRLPLPVRSTTHDCGGYQPQLLSASIGGTVHGRPQHDGNGDDEHPEHVARQDHRLDSLSLTVWHRELRTASNSGRVADVRSSRDLPPGLTCAERDLNTVQLVVDAPDPRAMRRAPTTARCRPHHRTSRPCSRWSRRAGPTTRATTRRRRAAGSGAADGHEHDARRAPSSGGCITSHDCAAVSVSGGGGASAFVWGTVYVPRADVDLDFGGESSFRFARGVVVHQLRITNLPPQAGFIPISLPHGGIYTDRTVELAATVGDDTTPTLTARVVFPDSQCLSDALTPPCPGEPAQIRAWQPKK